MLVSAPEGRDSNGAAAVNNKECRTMSMRRVMILFPMLAGLVPLPAFAADYAPPAVGLQVHYAAYGTEIGSELVTAIDGDRVTVERRDGEDSQTDRMILWRGLLLLEASFRSEQDVGLERFEPAADTPLAVLDALWPAKPGATATIRLEHLIGSGDSEAEAVANLNRAGSKTVTLSVEALEPVTVPAGRFDAIRIRRETIDAPDGEDAETLTETIWFVPSLGYAVKIRSTQADDDPEEIVAQTVHVNAIPRP